MKLAFGMLVAGAIFCGLAFPGLRRRATYQSLRGTKMVFQPTHDPGHHGNDQYDLTGHIGPLMPELYDGCQWPMYSFDRPAHVLWNAIGKQLHAQGWSDAKIKEWLQSKQT